MSDRRCPFCDPDPDQVFFETELVVGLWDRYSVSPGHAKPSRNHDEPGGFNICIDIGPAVAEKINPNAGQYPADLSRGTALKYSKHRES